MNDDTERSVASAGSVASDFIERARAWRDQLHYPTAGEMLDEAVGIIERLRLTDAERTAVSWARNALLVGVSVLPDDQTQDSKQHAATLLGLLERDK